MKGSTWVPVFDVDTSSDLNGLSKKAFNFMIGMLNGVLATSSDLTVACTTVLKAFVQLCLHYFII